MGKNNEAIFGWLQKWRAVIAVVAILVGVGIAYERLNGGLSQQDMRIAKQEVFTQVTREKADANEKAIIGLQKDVTFILTVQKEIKDGVDEIRRKLP